MIRCLSIVYVVRVPSFVQKLTPSQTTMQDGTHKQEDDFPCRDYVDHCLHLYVDSQLQEQTNAMAHRIRFLGIFLGISIHHRVLFVIQGGLQVQED